MAKKAQVVAQAEADSQAEPNTVEVPVFPDVPPADPASPIPAPPEPVPDTPTPSVEDALANQVVPAIEAIANPRWFNVTRSRIQAEVTLEGLGTTTMIVQEDDWSDLAREVWARVLAGEAGEIAEPAPDAPTSLKPLSQRQFFVGMTKEPWEVISQAEAMAFLKGGEIPAIMSQAIAGAVAQGLLPEGMTQFDVEAAVVAATQYELAHPFTLLIAGVLGWTEDELAAFWSFAATL